MITQTIAYFLDGYIFLLELQILAQTSYLFLFRLWFVWLKMFANSSKPTKA